ncbi:SusC/RagA family TonB-linked outer membrane protein [Pontibacter indicus]|uniref:TonB-linked outer membrane protein, SusC/RagA family n=1 Tax=Pontibacter indicus TaxID=1317125 RepID=A0A1R3XHF9_9BACT|nr:SusC/RagA family TonB-linked outer membrane protein [Pontibacter indicus]SIT89646.1 TonB-linked outer membrane protein, SusC/RagA family [Pontibacter indicus]
MFKHLLASALLMLLVLGVSAQDLAVSGQVVEQATGTALPGVTVRVKETNNGTTTNPDGAFQINAKEGEVLVFSYIGYASQEVQVNGNANSLQVQLQPGNTQLSEVIVTGALGIKRPARELGTASAQLNTAELTQGKVVNPILGLASKVSGLRINMFDSKVDPDVQVNLRGIRSHTGNNAPLYVVDGVPIPDINRLNPNDIESINVLKGANAAAVYGSDGVNGVLMITTKKGRAGTQRINYSNTTTFDKISRLPEQQTEFGQGLNGVYDPLQYQSWGPRFDGEMRPVGPVLPDGTQWQLPYSANADGRKAFFNTGFTTQNDLNFSGGDENSTYYFSLQDVLTKGIIEGDKNRRSGARFNGSRSFGKLSTSYNLNYVFNKSDVTQSEPWSTVYRLPVSLPFADLKDWENTPHANPNYWFSTNQPNPYFNADNQRTVNEQQTLTGNIELNYEIAPWINAIYRLGLYSRNTDTRTTVGKFTYTTPGRTNIPGSVNDVTNNFRRINSDFILDMHKDFGKFNTRLLLGNNLRTDDSKTTNLSASALVVPGLFNQDNRLGQLGGKSGISQRRQVAVFGELTAGYNNYLFLTFTGRQEAVSVLSPDNRSYFYPGVSSSFVFSDAIDALKNNNTFSYGKVYASYNRTGNVVVEPYQLQNVYSQTDGFPYGNLPGFSLGTSDANPNLKPEFVTSLEIGTQLSFFQNRLNLEAAYVDAKTTDGTILADISAGSGFTSAWVNAFKASNKIIELNINGDVIQRGDLVWNVGANLTHIKSKVDEIYGGIDQLFHFRQNYLIVGKPYNSYLFTDYKRDPEGRVIVDPKTGNPVSGSELYYGGTGTPPYQLGLNTSLQYKGFQLGAQFDWRMGAVVYTEAAARMISDGTSPLTTQYGREPFVIPNSVIETSPGVFTPNTDVKTKGDRNYFANHYATVQSNYAVSADFFKMRELSLSYTLPAHWLDGQKLVKEATIGFVGRNLFSIWAKDNIYNDPEFVYAGGSSEGYMSWRHLPPTRTFGFNVNVAF